MRLYLPEDRFHYELENVARMFFWQLEVIPGFPEEDGDFCLCAAEDTAERTALTVRCTADGKTESAGEEMPAGAPEGEKERQICVLLYGCLSRLTGKKPPFGIMTGIRPAKYAASLMRSGLTPEQVTEKLEREHLVSAEKAELTVLTARNGMRLAEKIRPRGYSLYVSVPFCPSRCSYCSFVSKSVEKEKKLIEPYVQALCAEMEHTGRIARELGLQLQTVYIGGGTPTVLSAGQLKTVTDCIRENFGAPLDGEFCVEAGRPDTVTEEKLLVLKDAGVTRISVNPQTGNDRVLELIGRRHTAADIERCYELARRLGFGNINADLIAGLPGDDLDSFSRSLDWVTGTLDPESVTVHALTLKRASRMREDTSELFSPDAPLMVEMAQQRLTAAGWQPYYMYRQKGTVDSLENTGYARPGMECLYNLFIMDELQSIIACGAGAVTKLMDPQTGLIRRVADLKYPKEYMDRFGEMLERKDGIREFYANI